MGPPIRHPIGQMYLLQHWNSFKMSTFDLKLFESKGLFLLFAQVLSRKHFPQLKQTHKANKIKSHIRNEQLSNTQNENFQVK